LVREPFFPVQAWNAKFLLEIDLKILLRNTGARLTTRYRLKLCLMKQLKATGKSLLKDKKDNLKNIARSKIEAKWNDLTV
jgi:hypothetical protein